MKPIKLAMTGFESYCNRTEIDFAKLNKSSIYLITGDTGSGKTTIFDAITFALYGSPSGKNRSESMLRSHFADENIPTEVELEFESRGKRYLIKRNPSYERPSKKGNGTTTEPSNAVLTFLDDDLPPVSGTSKVTEKVIELLNMKQDQFCQIAMIAQGAFQEMLLASTNEKIKIFRELFDTSKYQKLVERLKNENNNANDDLKKAQNAFKDNLAKLKFIKISDSDQERLAELQKIEILNEEDIEFLKKLKKNDQKLFESLKKEFETITDKIAEISSKIDEENRRQNLLGDKSKKESEIDEQKTMLKSFNDRLSKAQEEDKIKASLIQKQAILKETLPEYQAISEKEEKLLELKEDTEEKESQLAENENLCSKNKTRFDENKTKIEEIKDCEVKKVEIENQIKGCTQKINEAKDLKAKLTELQRDSENHRIATEKYKKSQSSFENANKEYEQKQKLFYAEQAGILAEILKEGEACPVCGSTSHPNLAQKSKEAPSEEEVNRLKGEAEKLRAAFDKIKDETTSLYAAIQEKTKVLDEGIKRQFENLSSEDENLTEKIDEFMAESNAEFEKLEDQQKSNEQNILLKQKLEKENEQIEKQNEAIEKQNTQLRETITKNRTTIENEKKAVEEKKSKLEFETLEKAQSEYQSLSERIAAIEKELDEAMKEKTECENTLHEKEGQLAKIKSDLETMPVQDLASLEEEKEKLDAKRSEKDMQRDEYNSQNTTNSNSLNEIEKLVPEIAAKSKRQTMIRGIYDIASGKNNDKIALETYVQTRFLDEITKYANLRLRVMTDNKYELVRRTEKTGGNGQSGLDFNIKDFYTGKERAVETLSGGEKFQSSLALALGLSDEVQMSSGGIKLDAMFIDEGFGTLDSEALNKAMKALSDLSKNNKQIGIISHVSELEEKIPYKIKVSKDKMTGISSIQIINDI